MFLSHEEHMSEYVNKPNLQDKTALSQELSNLMVQKSFYDQIRFIDKNGMERLRMKMDKYGKPYLMKEGALQNKADQEFFIHTIHLKPYEVYLSPLNMNEENGRIELPLKPIIRIATPIPDKDGSVRGILVLNLNAGYALRKYLEGDGSHQGNSLLVNRSGYYLLHPDPTKTWSFIDEGNSRKTFREDFPEAHKKIWAEKNGQFQNDEGLFTFQTLHPLTRIKEVYRALNLPLDSLPIFGESQDYLFKVISHVPESRIKEGERRIYSRLGALFAAVFVLLLFLARSVAKTLTYRRMDELKLKHSEEELRKVNITKDKFISLLAHDLKNPLSSIMGFAEVLQSKDEAFPEEQRRSFARVIRHSSRSMVELIDDVLDWWHAQSGTLVVQPEDFDVKELVEAVLILPSGQAEKKDIKLVTRIEEGLHAYADPKMIATVIRNLVSNAIKFSYREKDVIISAKKEHQQILISIQDFGIGISEANQKKLFQVGHKFYTKGTENEPGTGIGLILCKEFLGKNNSTIEVISTENKGTTFQFRLPASEIENT
jgi:signal transduction histidine kinase